MNKRILVVKKHIIKEGSRDHVIWWDEKGRHCSRASCEINHPGKTVGDKVEVTVDD